MATTATATQSIWQRIEPIYQSILEHPFLKGVQDGTLPHAAFGRYIVQDSLYLRHYARSLALCSVRAGDLDTMQMFATHASVAVATERELHEGLLSEMGIDPGSLDTAEMTPTCMAYTSFTKQACAIGERADGLASVLPCYWIYGEVGKELIEKGSPDPLYQRWIDTYADPAFAEAVSGCLGACDRAGAELAPEALESMLWHAQMAARYEWMFWDSAFQDERWPDIGG